MTGDYDLLALGVQLDAFGQAQAEYSANGATTPEVEAAEERRLAAWGASLCHAIATTRATTPAGRAEKLAAIAHANAAGGITPADRIA